jgi:hypothetical protein
VGICLFYKNRGFREDSQMRVWRRGEYVQERGRRCGGREFRELLLMRSQREWDPRDVI